MSGTTPCALQIYPIYAKTTFLHDVETTFYLKDSYNSKKLSSATLPCQEQNWKQISIDGAGSHWY